MRECVTPKRRHSSLFQRMEQEINKISRKISAAKTNLHKQSRSFCQDDLASPPHVRPSTLRKRRQSMEFPFDFDLATMKKSPLKPSRRKQQISNLHSPREEQLAQLIQENVELSNRVDRIEKTAFKQAHCIGFLMAERKDRERESQEVRLQSLRERVYLSKLVQGYKIKNKKLKGGQFPIKIRLEDI